MNESIDIEVLMEECGVGRLSQELIIANIIELKSKYDKESLVDIFSKLLLKIKDLDILYELIKIVDITKEPKILSSLLDILLLRNMDYEDQDKLVNIRVLASKAIANYKDASTLGSLLYCLNNKSENYKVRLACADALGRIGDRYAVEPLIDVVQDENEKSIYVKESATFALGLIGDTSAIEPLINVLEGKQGLLDRFSFLKEKIVEALGRLNINNKKVFKVLKKSIYDNSPIVRINAIEALMNSDFEEASDTIRIALLDDDEEVKRNALIALYNLLGRNFLDEVISLPSYSEFLKNEAKMLIEEYEED